MAATCRDGWLTNALIVRAVICLAGGFGFKSREGMEGQVSLHACVQVCVDPQVGWAWGLAPSIGIIHAYVLTYQ